MNPFEQKLASPPKRPSEKPKLSADELKRIIELKEKSGADATVEKIELIEKINNIQYSPPDILEIEGSLIFLAGPIQGAKDWQKEAVKIIHGLDPSINIASPKRDYLDGEFVYEKQVDWETHNLRKAAQNGVILFWLAKEDKHNCGRAYAQTSRFELAEWKIKHERDGVKLVIGIEDGFTGARYIRRRFSQDCPDVAILNSLEETCKKAVELLK